MQRARLILAAVTCLAVASIASTASAGPLASKAKAIAQKLQSVEGKLSKQDKYYIMGSLQEIEDLIGSSSPSSKLVCISNGDSGSFEKFAPHDVAAGKRVGGWTSKQSCQTVINGQSEGLICASNGDSMSFEKFSVYDTFLEKNLGGGTQLQSCLEVVSKATSDVVCVSNGDSMSFEKFSLMDRASGKTIGGGTSLSNCLGSIP